MNETMFDKINLMDEFDIETAISDGILEEVDPKSLKRSEPFISHFRIDPKNKKEISLSMREKGYFKEYPIVLWKEEGIVVSGNTRTECSIEEGIETVTIFKRSFKDVDEAMEYAAHEQGNRRNLKPIDHVLSIRNNPNIKSAKNKKNCVIKWYLCSPQTAQNYLTVAFKASDDEIVQLEKEEITFNQLLNSIKDKKKESTKIKEEDISGGTDEKSVDDLISSDSKSARKKAKSLNKKSAIEALEEERKSGNRKVVTEALEERINSIEDVEQSSANIDETEMNSDNSDVVKATSLEDLYDNNSDFQPEDSNNIKTVVSKNILKIEIDNPELEIKGSICGNIPEKLISILQEYLGDSSILISE